MKDSLKRIKGFWDKLSKKVKILVVITVFGVIIGAVVLASILNHKEYATLFTGINAEETTEILGKLQELGVECISNGDGTIMVPSEQVDTTRAQLAYDGYPKSGFTYDVFINNAGGMTTDMEKQTYKVYDLQNYIAATIRLFEGVKDAKVIIALEESQKYVIDDSATAPSAAVTVIMKDGGSPTARQAEGIQRLVSHAVPGMSMEDVTVLDGSGLEVKASKDTQTSGDVGEEIAQLVEDQIVRKVIHVLEPYFGPGNVRAAAKCQINMENVIRESTIYSTPEKIDENDKTGIISHDEWDREASGDGVAAGGIVGTETNSEIPQYTADATELNDGYYSLSGARDYLVNMIKEQGTLAPGMIDDLTISVSLNALEGGGLPSGLTRNNILELAGNAAGIAAEDRADKIAIAIAQFYQEPAEPASTGGEGDQIVGDNNRQWLIAAIIALAVFLMLMIILIIIVNKRRKKKKQMKAAEEALPDLFEESAAAPEQDDQKAKEDILNIKNERSRELRESVREFADANPEISAQMIKNWLHGGDDNAGNS